MSATMSGGAAWLHDMIKSAAKNKRRILLLAFAAASLKYMQLVLRRRERSRRLLSGAGAEGGRGGERTGEGKEGPEAAASAGTERTTLVSKESLPFVLAFVAGWYDVVCFKQYKAYANMMTGNTLQLTMKLGGGDRADVPLLAAAILHFSAGFSGYKYLDTRMGGKGSCTVVAPLVLALFTLADLARRRYPNSKYHMLLLAIAGGIVNSVSAEKTKLVTNMMTGHMQKMSSDVADHFSKGMSESQRASSLLSARVVATFCSGVVIGAAAYNVKHDVRALSSHKFTIVGAIYAAVLLLHEMPASRRR
jgi:uncharacterized membrane protein YoaK (UPF0700 family)